MYIVWIVLGECIAQIMLPLNQLVIAGLVSTVCLLLTGLPLYQKVTLIHHQI